MTRERRIDRGVLRAPRRTPNGDLRVDAVFTRTGVFSYMNPDGSVRREYRPDEEVFAPESLRSHELAPVTDDHPPTTLTPETARQYARGISLEGVRREGELVVGSLLVTDRDLIAKMEAGKTGVSLGYEVELDRTPGEHAGERYDAVQRRITGNHVAIVDVPRAGEVARVRMDAAIQCEENMPTKGTGTRPKYDAVERRGAKWVALSESGDPLGEFDSEDEARAAAAKSGRHDALASSVPSAILISHARGVPMKTNDPAELKAMLDAAVAEVAAHKTRADSLALRNETLTAEAATEKSRADKAEGQAESLKLRIADLEKERKDSTPSAELEAQVKALKAQLDAATKARADAEDPAKFEARVRARVAVINQATAILGDKVRFDGMSDRDIMVAVVSKLHGAIPADKSDEFVRGRYDAAVEGYAATESAIASVREVARAPRADAAPDARTARQKMIDANRSAWRQPAGAVK